jgi:CarD family transcriptional regulator
MFDIGDVIIYSEHGLCQIDDICEKTFFDVTRTYYVLHPLGQGSLEINTPVDNDKVVMLKMMNEEEAKEILQLFKQPGMDWIEDGKQRNMIYQRLVQSGNRKEIAKIANTLMRKNNEYKMNHKRIYDQDRKLLQMIQNILFKEIALCLDSSFEVIVDKVNKMIEEPYQYV